DKRNAYGLRVKDNEFGIYDWGGGVWRGAGVSLNDNKWHHLACAFQSGVANGTILYIDGEPKLTTTMTVSSQVSSATIGSGNPGTGENINALIDNAAIYNRVKTAEEIWDDAHIEVSGWAKYINLGEDGWIKLKHQNTGGNYWGSYLNNYSDGGGFYTMSGYGWNNTSVDFVGIGWSVGGYTSSSTSTPIAPVAFDSFRVTNYGCSNGVPSMYLQWTPSTWAEYYNYYRCQSDTSGTCGSCTYNTNPYPVLSDSCDSNSCANTDTQPTIATNTGYCYKLQASNPTGNTWATNNPPTYPHPFWKKTSFCPVSAVYTEGTTCGRIAVAWPKNMDAAADGYNVYRSNYFVSSYDGCSTLTDSKCKIVAQFGEALSQKNLIANWKMNEATWNGTAGEVIDSSIYANHGKAYGGATTATGKFKNAGSFDGTNDYVDVGNSANLNPSSAMTIELWVKFTSIKAGENWLIGRDAEGVRAYAFGVNDGYSNLQINGEGTLTVSTAISAGTWYHLAATGASSSGWIIYINGVNRGSAAWVAPNSVNENTYIGRRGYVGYEGYINGLIDNVAIYSRAKTAEEIYLDYQARQLNEMSDGGVNGCWISDNTVGGRANYNTVFEANTKNKLTTCTDSALCCQYRDNSVNPKVKYYYRVTVTSPGGESPASTIMTADTDSDGIIDCLDPDSSSYLKGCAQTLCYPQKREKEE
ncbi:MAG: LamG domain-containing protein, partial [Patescibacteria group bacterium]